MPQERPFFPESNNHRITPERGGRRFFARYEPRPKTPTMPKPDAPPPLPALTPEERIIANELEGRLEPKRTKKNRALKTALGVAETIVIVGVSGGVGYGVYHFVSPVFHTETHREASSDFIKHINDNSLPIPVVPQETTKNIKVNPKEVFDNAATKGIKSEGNTIQMTREEYEKIAPPAIDRTNVKQIPLTLNITPGLDGRTTRDLTLEEGSAVNAMIYVKTPEGNLRETTYEKVTDNGGVGKGPAGFVFPNCQTLLGLEGEIQAGDRFPAPISGRVYYSGYTVEDYKRQTKGKVIIDYQGQTKGKVIADYIIEGQYYDKKTGKTFKAIADVRMWRGITEPLIPNLPNIMDPAFNDKGTHINWEGEEVEDVVYSPFALNRMPIVTAQQGQDLFSFTTKPTVQKFSSDSKIKSQVVVSTSYKGDFDEIGANTFGGENCNHPTVDNKEIVLK